MVWAGIRGRSITTRVRSPPGSSLSRSGSPSRGQRASARTGLLSSRLERLFPSPRASRPSWDESPLVDPPFSSWATAPNSLSSWATAPNSRGQRPPTLSLRGQRPPTLVGNGPQLSLSSQATAPNSRGQRPQLSLAWAPAPSPAGVGPLPGGPCPISPQADRFDPSGGPSSLRLRAGRAQPRRGTAIPRARRSLCRSPLPVALGTARSQGWRARSPLPLASEAVWR